MLSSRKFRVAVCDSVGLTVEKVNIRQLLDVSNENKFEWLYAMQDIVDKVLDLKEGESITFQPNRDDLNSKGIILRTN